MCRVEGTCRGPVAHNTTPPGEKRLVLRLIIGREGWGNLGGTGAAYYGRRKCVKLVQGVLGVTELAVVCIVPSRVVWPPAP